MQIRFRSAALTLLAVAAALVIGVFIGRRDEPRNDSAPVVLTEPTPNGNLTEHADAIARRSSDAARNAVSRSPTIAPTAPLPPMSQPFANQLPVLLESAQRGDATAACRLVLSTLRCRYLHELKKAEAVMRHHLERGAGEAENRLIDRLARSEQEAGTYCDDVDVDGLPRIDELPAHALLGLTPWQKTMIAMARGDGGTRRLLPTRPIMYQGITYIMPELLARHSQAFLLDGFRARIPLALEGLILLHAPTRLARAEGYLTVQVPDRRLFVQYGLLMQRLYGTESIGPVPAAVLQSVIQHMPADDVTAANAWVDAESMRWAEVVGPSRPTPIDTHEVDDPDRYGCVESSSPATSTPDA